MAGFRLTGGGGGCPPTEEPPTGYQNPFRFDGAGRLWITSCFQGLQYFGAARHDITSGVAPSTATAPITTAGTAGPAISAGTYTSRTITNNTPCNMAILLAHDIIADLTAHSDNWVQMTLSERWNGSEVAQASIYSIHDPFVGNGFFRTGLHGSAAPHDVGADAAGGSTQIIPPGVSVVISARLYVAYPIGTYAPGDMINSASSAVRIYGYTLG